jgi:hypothetical protein
MLEAERQVSRKRKLSNPDAHCVVIPYWEAKRLLMIAKYAKMRLQSDGYLGCFDGTKCRFAGRALDTELTLLEGMCRPKVSP